MRRTVEVVAWLLSVLVVIEVVHAEWGHLVCKNGGAPIRTTDEDGIVHDRCICPLGFSAPDCSVCVANSACGESKRCSTETSLVEHYRSWLCTPLGYAFKALHGITYTVDSNKGMVWMDTWEEDFGGRYIMTCVMGSCTQVPEGWTMECEDIKCHCNDDICAENVKEIVDPMHGFNTWECDAQGRVCTFRHPHMTGGEIKMECVSGECLDS